MRQSDIEVGTTYRCEDGYGKTRLRRVDAIDTQPFIPPGERKVYFTDNRKGELNSMYLRSFARQAREVVV